MYSTANDKSGFVVICVGVRTLTFESEVTSKIRSRGKRKMLANKEKDHFLRSETSQNRFHKFRKVSFQAILSISKVYYKHTSTYILSSYTQIVIFFKNFDVQKF